MVYLRISQDRTGQEAGVDRQRQACERRVAERGWRLVAVHVDNDQSATKGRRRAGFEAVLADVAAARADTVVAWDMTRLQRNRRDELRLYELCQAKGARLSLVNGPDVDFTTAAGRFVGDSLGSVARLEVEMKSDRQRAANEQAAAAGRWVSGRRPFGYAADGITIVEDEAQAVREGYAALLSGVPVAQIARSWNERGFVTGQARRNGERSPWRRDSVRAVLRNPRYAGKRAHRGIVVADAEWPALVSEETWQAARALLDDPGRRSGPTSAKRMLSGLARCGVCGAGVHAGGSNVPGVPMYRCAGSMGHFGRRAEPVEDYVSAVMVARLSRDDARDLLHDHERPDVGELRTQANALRSRLDSLAVDFADGTLTPSQLRAMTARLREKLAEVERALADAGRINVLGPLVGASDVRATWDALDVARRRAVIDVLADVVIFPPGRGTRAFDPRTVRIDWRTP